MSQEVLHRQYVLAVRALMSFADLKSVTALARAASVNQSYLSETLRDSGTGVTTQYLARLTEPFGVSLSTFFLWGEQSYQLEAERKEQQDREELARSLRGRDVEGLVEALVDGDLEFAREVLESLPGAIEEKVKVKSA